MNEPLPAGVLRRPSGALFLWLALFLFVCGGMLIWMGVNYANRFTAGQSTQGEPDPSLRPPPRGSEAPLLERFELTERSGRALHSEDLAGQIHVVSFFFASCPASCRTQNHTLAGLEREFGKQGVKFLAITCDPKNDTPERLRRYAQEFNAPQDRWLFLTGELPYIRRVASDIYTVPLDEKVHVERFIVVDQQGEIVGRYAWQDEKELNQLKTVLRDLVAGKPVQPQVPKSTAPPKGAWGNDDEEQDS